MSRGGAALALAAALVAGAASAEAAPDAALALLDADAGLVVSIQPLALWRSLDALAAVAGRPSAARAWFAALAQVEALLGAELRTEAAWRQAGLATAAPVVGSIAAIDPAAALSVFNALASAPAWDDRSLRRIAKTYWRSRFVLAVANRRRVARAVHRLALREAALEPVEPERAAAVAALLGNAGGRAPEATVRALRRAGVLAVGPAYDRQGLMAVRLHHRKDLLVIEVLVPFAGVPVVWRRDARAVLALLTRHDRRAATPAPIAGDDRARLLDAALGLWLRPAAALAAARAASMHAGLAAAAALDRPEARAAALAATAELLERCEALRPLATRGPLGDAVARIEATTEGARVELRWRVRREHALIAALTPRPRALPVPAADARAGAVWLAELAALAKLPRDPALGDGTAAWRRMASRCGAGASVAMLVGWPVLAAAELAAVRATDAWVAAAIDAASGAAIALPPRSDGDRGLVAALAVDPAGATAVAAALDRDVGVRGRDAAGAHWALTDGGIAFSEPLSDTTVAVGRARGEADRRWLLAATAPGPAAAGSPDLDLLASYRLELAALAGLWGDDQAQGELAGTLRLGRRELVAELEVRTPTP